VNVSQQKLLSVLKKKVRDVDESERVAGYQTQLFDSLGQIVLLEREHLESATQISKKVGDKVQALGAFLTKEGWRPE
jgi:protein-tyrosine-phosphatase